MMPDFKSGITFSFFPHVQLYLQSACNGHPKCSGGFVIRLHLASKNVQADLQSSCIWHPKMFRRICNPPATGTLKSSGGFAIRLQCV